MMPPYPLDDQIAEAERELATRVRIFPRWVEEGRITAETAVRRIDLQRNIVETLRRTPPLPNDPRAARALQQELFDAPPPKHGDPTA